MISIIYCFFIYYLISGNIHSDLVVDIPAKFLDTLQDIITSNRTPGIMEGHSILEDLESSQGELCFVKKKLAERIRERNTHFKAQDPNSLIEFVRRMKDDKLIMIYPSDIYISGIKDIICMMSMSPEILPKVKVSNPFDSKNNGYFYSSKINAEVVHRLSITRSRMHESGLIDKPQSLDNTKYCRTIMDMTDKQEKRDIQLPFYVFELPMICYKILVLFALLVFIIEFSSSKQIKYNSKKREKQSLVNRALNFVIELVIPFDLEKKKNNTFCLSKFLIRCLRMC